MDKFTQRRTPAIADDAKKRSSRWPRCLRVRLDEMELRKMAIKRLLPSLHKFKPSLSTIVEEDEQDVLD